MQYPRVLIGLLVLLTSSSFLRSQAVSGSGLTADDHKTPAVSLSGLPLSFEPNVGQGVEGQRFLSRAGEIRIGFSAGAISLRLPMAGQEQELEVTLAGASKDARITPGEKRSGESNYLLGNQPSAWKTHIPQYARLTYRDIYPGVDLLFYGTGQQVEHDFVVQPGADYHQIRIRYQGTRRIALAGNGDLRLAMDGGEVIVRAPQVYQEANGRRQQRTGSFILRANGEVAFDVPQFDATLPLVIDPVFGFSTYLGGTGMDIPSAVTTDSAGNIFVTGHTNSADFPTKNAEQPHIGVCSPGSECSVAFITKLDPTGKTLIYSTYLGGSYQDEATAIAVDSAGNAIIAGNTTSWDFPQAGAVVSPTCQTNQSCYFLASLKPNGSALNYAGAIGGTTGFSQNGSMGLLAIDPLGNAYLSGVTDDSQFQLTPGTLSSTVTAYPNEELFALKVDSTGKLVYSTVIPGNAPSTGYSEFLNEFQPAGLSVDSAGQLTIAGTAGQGLPTTPGVLQPTFPSNANAEGFVLQLNAKASAINYASYLPGADNAGALSVDANGNLYIAGSTSQKSLQVSSNAYQKVPTSSQYGGISSGYVLKLDAAATTVLAATYLDGTASNSNESSSFTAIALDSHGNVFLGGTTGSPDFPLMDPFTTIPESAGWAWDMVLAELNPDLSSLLFGSFLDAPDLSYGGSTFSGIAVDPNDNLVVAGSTYARDFPTTAGSFEPQLPPPASAYSTPSHVFVAKIDMATPAPSVCLDTETIAFGGAPVHATVTQTLHVTNCGNAPLKITSLASSDPTVVASQKCGSIAPGTACPVTLSFAPVSNGAVAGTLTITDNAVLPPPAVSFSGQGQAPSIFVQPASVVFPAQVLGDTSSAAIETVFIQNRGAAPLTIDASQSKVTGDFKIANDSCSYPLSSNLGCAIGIAFSPSALGTRTGTLTIASNDPSKPQLAVFLSGTALAAYPAPSVTSIYPPSAAIGTTGVSISATGTGFFPDSTLVVGGEPLKTYYSSSTVLSATVDPSLLSMAGELPITVVNPAPGGQSKPLPFVVFQASPISAAGMVYNSATQMLYASIPANAGNNANTVLPIDPSTGQTGIPIPVGNDPGKLALSTDNAYLYVCANKDHTLQRINLATSAIERTFALPLDNLTGATNVYDMHGVPGLPKSVVVSLSRSASPSEAGAALFTDAGLVRFLGDTYQDNYYDIDSFTFASSPSVFYAYPFNKGFFSTTAVSPTGLQAINPPGDSCCDETTGSLVASDGTLLYTNSGQVWNPASSTLLGTYSAGSRQLFYEPAVVPDTSNKRTYFLDTDVGYNGIGGYTDILSFDQTSKALVGTVALSLQSAGWIADLARFGSNGFAFRAYLAGQPSSSNEIVLVHSSIVPTATGGTPSLTSLQPSSLAVGSPTTQVTVNGKGFVPGTTVSWGGVALETNYVSATQLIVLAPSTEFATVGNAQVTATNPSPGGKSGGLTFNILGPKVSLSSVTASLGSVTVGTTSTATPIKMTNSGTAALTGIALAFTGADAPNFAQTNTCGVSLAAGASCTISLTFKPLTSGAKLAALTLTDSAPDSPQTIGLSGTGTLAVPTLVFASIASHAFGDSPFTVSASSASSGLITYSVTSGPATLSGATVTIIGIGKVVLGAIQAATAQYASASASVSFTVGKGTPAISWAKPAPIDYGTPVDASQLNATSTVAGTFAYSPAAGTVLAPGPQTLSVTFTPADASDYSSAKASVVLTVNKASQTISFAPLASQVSYGVSPLKLAASASSGLAVAFAASGPVTLTGTTLTITGVGAVVVTASQSGNGNYAAAPSAAQTITVVKGMPAVALSASSNSIAYGSSVTFTATVTGGGVKPAGTVTFYSGSTALGTGTLNGNGIATLAQALLPVGPNSITASYAGDSHYAQATSTAVIETVNQATPTLKATSSAASAAYGASVSLQAAASGNGAKPTGTVIFSIGSVQFGSAVLSTAGTATLAVISLPVGKDSVTASYGGDSNYLPASATVSVTITKASQTIAFSALPATATYGVSPLPLSATATSALPVTFSAGAPSSVSGNTLSIGGAGTVVVTASQPGNGDYSAAPAVQQTIKVSKATPAVSLTASSSTPVAGATVVFTATLTGVGVAPTGTVNFLDGKTQLGTATLNISGVATVSTSKLAAGVHSVTASFVGDGNYSMASSSTLNVTVTAH